MAYSICGLIVPEGEACVCAERNWPCARLAGDISLIPLERDFVLLTEGDETEPSERVEFQTPEWLAEMASRFTKAAYIEAEFWGGKGAQAAIVWEKSVVTFGPEISAGAINAALRRFGLKDASGGMLYGVPVLPGKDLFDTAGLGRHRSVQGWLHSIGTGGG